MGFMAAALPYITAAASVGQTIAQGNVQEAQGKIQARQLREQSIAAQAESVQTANQERRRADLLKSRVTALAAASGASGQNIERTISDIDEQGEYNALAALHSGKSAARSKSYAATVAQSQGSQARSQSRFSAGGTILSAIGKKYG